jgi:hypothetical protein
MGVIIKLDPIQKTPEQSRGLSNNEAIKRFVDTAEPLLLRTGRFSIRPDFWIILIPSSLLFVAFFIEQRSIYLVEALLLLAAFLFNIWLSWREFILGEGGSEIINRIKFCIAQIKKFGIDYKDVMVAPTISVVKCYRDGQVIMVPSNLLVQDDLILLAFGDVSPAHAKHVSENLYLSPSELFRPDLLRTKDQITHQIHEFIVSEAPIVELISTALNSKSPETIIASKINYFNQFITHYVFGAIALFSLLVNGLRLLISFSKSIAIDLLVCNLAYILLPVAPIITPLLIIGFRTYGNAHVLTVFDLLQSSKSEFQDKADIDEFDAAPAPLKNISVSFAGILKKLTDQLSSIDHDFLARRTGSIVDALGSISVLCAIDREGTISELLPRVDQMLYINENGDPIIFDVKNEPKSKHGVLFEDSDWEQHLKLLRPSGLNFMVCSDCKSSTEKRTHEKSGKLMANGRFIAAHHSNLF